MVRTEVQHRRERAAHSGEPLDDVVRHARQEEVVPCGSPREPVAAAAPELPVEDIGVACHTTA
jgi:hypothetical protein